jgi:SAM-dependent methyltransferase
MTDRLHQRGRASLDFAAVVGKAIGRYTRKAMQELRAGPLATSELPEDFDARARYMASLTARMPSFRTGDLCREWYSVNHGRVAVEAFDEAASDILPTLADASDGPATLDPGADVVAPAYWSDHWIHRTHGGWDGHPYMGYVMAALVHGYLVREIMGTDLSAQRRLVVDACVEFTPQRILELGCGPGQFTRELAAAFPAAHIVACDLSLRQLEEAQRRLNRDGRGVRLLRRAAEDTRLPAGSFDLVVSYAILHELPRTAIAAIFRESFRVLRPGGVLMFADVPPYSELSPLLQWQVDYAASREGEPFWRDSATMDRAGALAEAGFTDIRAYGLKPGDYPFPWINRARKPG